MKKQYRQGDILIEKINKLPYNLKPKEDLIIARGETTGHVHRLDGGQVLVDIEGNLFLNLAQEQTLLHEEHKPIVLPPGKYRVIRQREYDEKEIRTIED